MKLIITESGDIIEYNDVLKCEISKKCPYCRMNKSCNIKCGKFNICENLNLDNNGVVKGGYIAITCEFKFNLRDDQLENYFNGNGVEL